MSPLINWEELREITMPPEPPRRMAGESGNMWDNSADMYNQMSDMEKSYTLNQIKAFETSPDDTVFRHWLRHRAALHSDGPASQECHRH